jgi:hypothetical protein
MVKMFWLMIQLCLLNYSMGIKGEGLIAAAADGLKELDAMPEVRQWSTANGQKSTAYLHFPKIPLTFNK